VGSHECGDESLGSGATDLVLLGSLDILGYRILKIEL
jgi:hypothetical protein